MEKALTVGILSGGKSSRMGRDKTLLKFKGKSFLENVLDEFSSFDDTCHPERSRGIFSEIIVSIADKNKYENIIPKNIKIVCDENNEIGPIEGIRQVLKNAKNDFVFICAADMPFLKKELALYLAEFVSSDYDAYVISSVGELSTSEPRSFQRALEPPTLRQAQGPARIHPLCAIYSKKILGEIEEAIKNENYKIRNVLDKVRTKYIKIEDSRFDKKLVANVNTPDEYKALALPIVFCVSGIKNSGKTTLVEKLIAEFKKENFSVGVIKHDGHDYKMDHDGTDTMRFKTAGADKTAIFSDFQWSVNATGKTTPEKLQSIFGDVDVIIIEGLKNSCYPKIEVVRNGEKGVCDEKTVIMTADAMGDVSEVFGAVKDYFGI